MPRQDTPQADTPADAPKTDAAANGDAAATAAPEKKQRAPMPDGCETPVNFAKRLTAHYGREIRPQIVYGYIRNSKTFPTQKDADDRPVVPIEQAMEWIKAKDQRKAEREAADKAKAAAAAAQAEATPAAEPANA